MSAPAVGSAQRMRTCRPSTFSASVVTTSDSRRAQETELIELAKRRGDRVAGGVRIHVEGHRERFGNRGGRVSPVTALPHKAGGDVHLVDLIARTIEEDDLPADR